MCIKVWDPVVGEMLMCKEFGNIHHLYAISVVRDGHMIVGHSSSNIIITLLLFEKNETISCQITRRR